MDGWMDWYVQGLSAQPGSPSARSAVRNGVWKQRRGNAIRLGKGMKQRRARRPFRKGKGEAKQEKKKKEGKKERKREREKKKPIAGKVNTRQYTSRREKRR